MGAAAILKIFQVCFLRHYDPQLSQPLIVLLCPAEVLERHTSVPYFGHVGDPVAVELHYVDIVRADRATGGRNRPTLTGMRSMENSVGGNIVPRAVRRE